MNSNNGSKNETQDQEKSKLNRELNRALELDAQDVNSVIQRVDSDNDDLKKKDAQEKTKSYSRL